MGLGFSSSGGGLDPQQPPARIPLSLPAVAEQVVEHYPHLLQPTLETGV